MLVHERGQSSAQGLPADGTGAFRDMIRVIQQLEFPLARCLDLGLAFNDMTRLETTRAGQRLGCHVRLGEGIIAFEAAALAGW